MKKYSYLISLLAFVSFQKLNAQQFAFHSNTPFGIQPIRPDSTGVAQQIMWMDADGDGDLDLFLAGLDYYDGLETWDQIHYFLDYQENIGDKYHPQFAPRVAAYDSFPYPLGYFFTAVGELNHDGKPDFVSVGDVNSFGGRNTRLAISTGRSTDLFDVLFGNAFELREFVPESFFVPELVDLDLDGDLDLLMSGFDPAFAEEDGPDIPIYRYARNRDVRSSGDLLLEGWYTNPYELTPSPFIEVLTGGDIDNDDDMDLLGTYLFIPPDSLNNIYVHLNSPDINQRPSFPTTLASPFGLPTSFGESQFAFPKLADMDGDGDLDLFVFHGENDASTLQYYENNLCAIPIQEIAATICEGESFIIAGNEFIATGDYTLHLESQNHCDSAIHLQLTVDPLPTANLSASICAGESYSIAGEIFTESGNYMIFLASENGCDTLLQLTLTVDPLLTLDIQAAICEGDSYTLGGQTFTQPGTYQDTLHAETGCDTIANLTLTVDPLPTTSFSAVICEGDAFSIGGQTFSTPGDYTVTLPAETGCDTIASFNLSLSIIEPGVDVTDNHLIAFEANATYQWIDCDSGEDIPGATNQDYFATITGNYAVHITNSLGCEYTSSCTFVEVTATNKIYEGLIMVYPNPAYGKVWIKNETSFEVKGLTAVSLQGITMREFPGIVNDVDLSDLPAGLYLIKLEVNGVEVVKKIIKL